MFECLFESSDSFIVVSIFVNFDVGAGFEKGGETVIGFGFGVEHDDVLHEFGVLVPIGSLEEVGS